MSEILKNTREPNPEMSDFDTANQELGIIKSMIDSVSRDVKKYWMELSLSEKGAVVDGLRETNSKVEDVLRVLVNRKGV